MCAVLPFSLVVGTYSTIQSIFHLFVTVAFYIIDVILQRHPLSCVRRHGRSPGS